MTTYHFFFSNSQASLCFYALIIIGINNDVRRLGAKVGAERLDGVTPLLLAAQEGHLGWIFLMSA